MKKTKILRMLFASLLVAVFFTSCSNNDENNEAPKVYTAEASITFQPQTLGKCADFTLEYYNSDGTLESIPVEGNLSRKITYTKLPSKVGFKIIPSPKSSLSETELYSFTYKASISINVLEDGVVIDSDIDDKIEISETVEDMSYEDIHNVLTKYHSFGYFATVDSKGNAQKLE